MGGSTESRTGVLTASASAPAARTRPVDGRDSEASEFGPGLSRESPFVATDGAAATVVTRKRRQWGTQAILTIPSIMRTHNRGAVMRNRENMPGNVDPRVPRSCSECHRRSGETPGGSAMFRGIARTGDARSCTLGKDFARSRRICRRGAAGQA